MIGKDTSGLYDIYSMYLLWDFLTNLKSKQLKPTAQVSHCYLVFSQG